MANECESGRVGGILSPKQMAFVASQMAIKMICIIKNFGDIIEGVYVCRRECVGRDLDDGKGCSLTILAYRRVGHIIDAIKPLAATFAYFIWTCQDVAPPQIPSCYGYAFSGAIEFEVYCFSFRMIETIIVNMH